MAGRRAFDPIPPGWHGCPEIGEPAAEYPLIPMKVRSANLEGTPDPCCSCCLTLCSNATAAGQPVDLTSSSGWSCSRSCSIVVLLLAQATDEASSSFRYENCCCYLSACCRCPWGTTTGSQTCCSALVGHGPLRPPCMRHTQESLLWCAARFGHAQQLC